MRLAWVLSDLIIGSGGNVGVHPGTALPFPLWRRESGLLLLTARAAKQLKKNLFGSKPQIKACGGLRNCGHEGLFGRASLQKLWPRVASRNRAAHLASYHCTELPGDAHSFAANVCPKSGFLKDAVEGGADARAPRLQALMDRAAVNVTERGEGYRRSGWTRFDPAATPYTGEQVRQERKQVSLSHRSNCSPSADWSQDRAWTLRRAAGTPVRSVGHYDPYHCDPRECSRRLCVESVVTGRLRGHAERARRLGQSGMRSGFRKSGYDGLLGARCERKKRPAYKREDTLTSTSGPRSTA